MVKMSKYPDFTEAELFAIMAYLVDAADPRIPARARNDLLEKSYAINYDLTLILLGNMLSGLLDRVADMMSVLDKKPKDKWIEDYLVDMRKNIGNLPISRIFPENE